MSDVVIRAEKLSKRYRIGERERYLALRDVLTRALTAPVRMFSSRTPALRGGTGPVPSRYGAGSSGFRSRPAGARGCQTRRGARMTHLHREPEQSILRKSGHAARRIDPATLDWRRNHFASLLPVEFVQVAAVPTKRGLLK